MLSIKISRNLLKIQLFIILIIKIVYSKSTFRVEHKLNIYGEPTWNTVPVNLITKEKKNANIDLSKNLVIHSNNTLKGTDAFVIDFTCKIKNKNTCSKAKKGFELAAKKISEVLNIYEGPILVNATLVSFCELAHPDGSACNYDDPTRRKLGQAYPYSSYPARAINPDDGDTNTYLYPQALLRQLNIASEEPEFSSYDIVAEFNSDVDWYFEEDDDDNISNDEHDFVYVAIHEFIHGLGFISSWRTVLDLDYHYLTPRAKMGISHNQDVVMGWYQMQIFDKYIYVNRTQTSLAELGEKIMKYEDSGKMLRQDVWLTGFKSSKEGELAKEIYDISTSGKMAFSFISEKDNFITYLMTNSNSFISGTCMGHLDNDEYTNKPDFLLRPYVPIGEDLETLIHKGAYAYLTPEEKKKKDLWHRTEFGPHLLTVMETIGWPTKYNLERRSVEIINSSLSRYINNNNKYLRLFLFIGFILLYI